MSVLRHPGVRSTLVLGLLVIIGFVGREHLHFIGDGWRELGKANNGWILAAVVALAISMVAQAELMVILLRSAGITVKRGKVNVLGLAANAWSATFPGGPALSAAMIFREQLRWGATPVIASWYMLLSGAIAGGGMALLALGAVFFLGLTVKPATLLISILFLLAIAGAANWLATHPVQVERWLIRRVKAFNRWRKQPEERWVDQLEGFSHQLAAVRLPFPTLLRAVIVSLGNWVFEILCLIACIYAVGADPAIAAVTLSFLAAKLVGQAQVTPGGLGPVDVALTSALVGVAGMTSVSAFAAVIVFRMLSFVGLTAVGWLVYFAARVPTPRAVAAEKTRG